MAAMMLTRPGLEQAVGAALSAPSVMNTQPWRFRVYGDVIDLVADPSRGLPHQPQAPGG